MLGKLPQLPRILPPPGTARRAAATAVGVDQKVLARVRALLAKAESTQFPAEAEALSALDITELLATSLLVQATRAMVTEGRQVSRTGTSRTRSFRQPFLLPVLADRSRVVDDAFQEMYSCTVQKSVTISNRAGWQAGRNAADRADLTVERREVTAS